MNTHLKLEDDEVLRDGERIRVSMMVLDAVQRKIANHSTLDQRVNDNIEAGQSTLKAMQRKADRAAGFADHFTAQREAQADTSPYAQHCQRLSNDWQAVA